MSGKDVNSFFGIDGFEPDDQIDIIDTHEYNRNKHTEEMYQQDMENNRKGKFGSNNKNKNNRHQKDKKSKKGNFIDTLFKPVQATIIIVASLIMMSVTMYSIYDSGIFGAQGIQANMETNISGKTISELSEMTLTVANVSRRDSSPNTSWKIGEKTFSIGSNNCKLIVEMLSWGDNKIVAENGDTKVEFNINIEKTTNTDDKLHALLSSLDNPNDSWYEACEKYELTSSDDILGSTVSGIHKNEDGNYVTQYELKDNSIIINVTESKPLSLAIGKPISLPESLLCYDSVQVYGNFEDVISAEIEFKSNLYASDEVTLYKIVNMKMKQLTSSEFRYYNGSFIVNVKEPAIFIMVPKTVELENLISYSIGFIDLGEKDEISFVERKGNKGNLAPANISKAMTDGAYMEAFNGIQNDATEIATDDIVFTLMTWKNGISMLNKEDIIQVRDYSNSGLENAIATMMELNNYKSNNMLLVIDMTDIDYNKMSKIAKLFSKLSNDDINITGYLINCDNYNIRDYAKISDNVRLIYRHMDDVNFNSIIEDIDEINFNISLGSEVESSVDGIERKMVKLVDYGIKFNNDNVISDGCRFDDLNDTGYSFGQSLFTKLAINKQLKTTMFNASDYLSNDNTETVDTSKCSVNPTIASEEQLSMNSGALSKINENTLVSMCNILNLAKYNGGAQSLVPMNHFEYDYTYTYFADRLLNELRTSGPLLAAVKCDYGIQYVLLTGLSQDSNNPSKFYVDIYNPAYPGEKHTAELSSIFGVSSDTGEIGRCAQFIYRPSTDVPFEFNEIYLVSNINICSDKEIIYKYSLSDSEN